MMNEQMLYGREAQKLQPDWKKEPKVMDLKQDKQDALPVHQSQTSQIDTWLDNLHVRGKAQPPAIAGRSSIAPRLIRKQAEWRYSALSEPFLATPDLFKVEPVSWEDRKAAQQNQVLLNSQFRNSFNLVNFIDEYIRTCVDEGTVICKTGWEFKEEEYTEEVEEFQYIADPEFAETIEQVAKMELESPSEFMALPEELKVALATSKDSQVYVRPVGTGVMTSVTKTRTTYNRPTVEVCDYRNLIIDPSCKGVLEKAKFIIHTWETSLAELKADGRYKNLEYILIDNNSILSEPDHVSDIGSSGFNFNDNPRKRIVVNEYWGFYDTEGNDELRPIVAAWVGDVMIRLENNPFPDKALPFVSSQYLPVRKQIYGEPDGALLEEHQKVMGAVTRGMVDILGRSANGQMGMAKNMLDAGNRRKWENGENYMFNPGTDPRQGVYMHTFSEIPQAAQFLLTQQGMEAESLTGVKSFQQGISSASLGQVAAGIRGALDASSKRELGILRRISQGIIGIARKWMAMSAVFLSEMEVVRITNEQFVTVRKDDLAGNFDLKLGISTAEEDDNKAQQLAFMLQTMGPNSDPELVKMILADIARLRKMVDLAKKIETFQPQPDPMAVRIQELTIAKLEAEVTKIQAETQKLGTGAILDQAKVGTEQARAGQLQADADLKNLDFVEQESGVKQERDLQKQGAQARAQTELKMAGRDLEERKLDNDLIKTYLTVKAKEKAQTKKS